MNYAYDESKMLTGIQSWRQERTQAARKPVAAPPSSDPAVKPLKPSRFIPMEHRKPIEQFSALPPAARLVCEAVCDEFCLTIRELTMPTNRWETSKVRHVAFYLLVRVMGLSMPRAGFVMGGYHHTTVLNGVRVTEKRMQDEADYCQTIQRLVRLLSGAE